MTDQDEQIEAQLRACPLPRLSDEARRRLLADLTSATVDNVVPLAALAGSVMDQNSRGETHTQRRSIWRTIVTYRYGLAGIASVVCVIVIAGAVTLQMSVGLWRDALLSGPSVARWGIESWGESPVRRIEQLRAPGFDDASAFGDREITQIDAWLQEQLALAGYPSLNVAITRGGKVVYQRAFGFQDLESRTKATPETLYHTASVTKVFTTTLAVMLHERGIVDLDERVVDHLPEGVFISTSPERGARITLRQLASHTSGLPRGVPGAIQSAEGRYQLEPKRLYEHLADVELVFDPGTDERYSNLGMGLLGHVLERAAAVPFHRLLQEEVFNPQGLEQSTIHVINRDKLRLATGYSSGRPRRPERHSYVERLVASGGLVASAPDLARFLSAQMEPGPLSSKALTQLHTPTKLSDGSAARTALGWSVRERESTGRILKKNGGRNNCSAWIGFAPDHGVGVAVVTNCGEPNVDPIGYWLLERCVLGVEPSLLNRKPFVKREYAKVAPFTGVRWENDRPVVRVRGRWSRLVSIDGVPVDRIMDFAHREFGEKARKRFAEDLVEVLSTMGHEPEWKVTLAIEKKDGRVEELEEAMTLMNRNRVRMSP